jgi:hypothetical protein
MSTRRELWSDILVPGFALGILFFVPTFGIVFFVLKWPFDASWNTAWICLIVAFSIILSRRRGK